MSSKSTNSSSKRQEPLKQGTLSFATVKRIPSSNTTNKPKSLKPTKAAPASKTNNSANSTEDDFDDIESHLSDDEGDEIEDSPDAAEDHKKITLSGPRALTRPADKHTTAKKSSQEQKPVASAILDVSKTDEKLELVVNDPKWNKHYAEVKKQMGYLPPIHGEKQNRIDEILRVFDLSDYGPCVGITRVERWETAQALGLNPPKEVYDILNTKQGSTLPRYSESVFHEEV